MSGSTGDLRPNTDRAARVQRLKTAVAERKRERERRETGKRTSRPINGAVSVRDAEDRRTA